MWIGRVTGAVVATQKHGAYAGRKLLLIQPLRPEGEPEGTPVLAVDTVDAGPGDRVLVTGEGRSAREAIGDLAAPVDAAVVGVVDRVDLPGARRGSETE